jgi:hypothetical protein
MGKTLRWVIPGSRLLLERKAFEDDEARGRFGGGCN